MTVTSPEYATPQPAPAEQPAPQPPKSRSTALIVAAAVGGLVVLIAAAAAITYVIVSPGANDPESFIPACRDQVKARLRSPSTAKFPGTDAVDKTQSPPAIIGAVDSQNGFGALVRTDYSCTLTKDSNGNLRISDVTVQ